jgi:two-component system chemotaxis response regulator CheB
MVRVLVVDDSAFMRNALSNMLSSDPQVRVIGTAKNGVEAIAKVKTLKPDIVTLDVEMPRMDGIEALTHIMNENPLPVVMVSSLTTEEASVTFEALELGALDFIPKNLADLSVNILKIKSVLIEKIKQLAAVNVRMKPQVIGEAPEGPQLEQPVRVTGERRIGIMAIGTSTGGPKALQSIVPLMPVNFPVPIVIAQHMPPSFTGPFAERLNQLSKITVKEAGNGETLKHGVAYIAPGGGHMRVRKVGAIETVAEISEDKEEFIYRPSVDALMQSASESYPGRALAVILTGMGTDGIKGIAALKESGGRVFAQSEESCVVYGMPKAVVDLGLADKVLPLEDIPGEILNSV